MKDRDSSGRFIKIQDNRNCINCGSDKTYLEDGSHPVWFKYNDGFYCKKCYAKLIDNPKHHPINSRRRLWFKNKVVMLKENPRKGICEWCYKEGLTHMHHVEYHDKDPLRDTVELCPSCHYKESWRLRKLNS